MIESTFQPNPSRNGGDRRVFAARRRFTGQLLFAAALLSALAMAPKAIAQYEVRVDVPFVATPYNVVERMLEIAEVKPGDLVMDLGCGDGRTVVTAAKKYGAHGVGVDIDPNRIAEAKGNARWDGVADKAEFRIGDLFATDISKTDVLAIYLSNEINMRLRPTILKTMKPGSRVVSHSFHMGDWVPDHEESVSGQAVYFWVVPAPIAGRWQVREGNQRVELVLTQTFQNVYGSATIDGRTVPLREARLKGSELSYVIDGEGGQPRRYRGRIEGDRIEAFADAQTPWQATRLAR